MVFASITSRPRRGHKTSWSRAVNPYYLQPEHVRTIGERLISIPRIRRFRFASGLAVAPARTIDHEDDWANALADASTKAKESRKVGGASNALQPPGGDVVGHTGGGAETV